MGVSLSASRSSKAEPSTACQTAHQQINRKTTKSRQKKKPANLKDVICYLTDVEGNGYYFASLLNGCPVVQFDGTRLCWEKDYQEHGHMVYGGDTVDKGSSDKLIVKSLIAFKKKYPERVILILGNRDVNKLRLYNELHEDMYNVDALPDPQEISQVCYWDPKVWRKGGGMSYPSFLTKGCIPSIHASCYVDNQLPHSWLSILLWILHCTMGAVPAFEARRLELARETNVEPLLITNKQIYDDFYNSVNPNAQEPWMLEYIRLGQIVGRIGNNIFVHGAIDAKSLHVVPGRQDNVEDMDEWFEALNGWSRRLVQEWIKGNTDHPNNKSPQSKLIGPLLDYGLLDIPTGNRGPGTPSYHHHGISVMYDNWLVDGNAVPMDVEVFEFLRDNQVDIFTGHQPHGDVPMVMLGYGSQLEASSHIPMVLSADTSYSDRTRASSSHVTIYSDHCHVEGVRANNSVHGFSIPRDSKARSRTLIGRQMPDGSWIKTMSEGKLCVVKGKGFSLSTRLLSEKFVRKALCGVQEFPKSVGPFDRKALPMDIVQALQLGEDTWSLPEVAIPSNIKAFVEVFPEVLKGTMSPVSPITLTGKAKLAAGIPEDSTKFCWFYPAHRRAITETELTAALTKAGKYVNFDSYLLCLLTVGGFGYLSESSQLVGLNAIRPDLKGGLQFDYPHPWAPWKTAHLKERRWLPIQTPCASVKYYCWVYAGETVMEENKPQILSQHGGFVFLAHHPAETNPPPHVLGLNMFFPMVGGEEVTVDILPRWLEHEMARDVYKKLLSTGNFTAGRNTPFSLTGIF